MVSTYCIWKNQTVISRCSKKKSFSKACSILEDTLQSLTVFSLQLLGSSVYPNSSLTFSSSFFPGGERWSFPLVLYFLLFYIIALLYFFFNWLLVCYSFSSPSSELHGHKNHGSPSPC